MTAVRVLHVDPERGWGGGEVQVLGLIRELGLRGQQATLAADPAGRIGRAAADAGIPVVPLRIANHVDVRAALRLRRLIAGHDVVHFHTARAHALAPWCPGGVRRIVTRRMDYVPRGGPYVRLLYNRAVDRVIAISEGVRAALLRAGVEAGRIRVVSSGVDVAAFADVGPATRDAVRRAWGIGAEATVVLVVGALEERKGHAVLLDAARRLRPSRPDLRLVFCGDGSARQRLETAAAKLGGTVVFAGFRSDVAACLAAADVVALPSLHEGLGVAALEAMAAERPVVASRVGGLAEVIVEGETGALVPPGDTEALARAVDRLAADPSLRARLGAAGRARVVARHTMARMAEGTLACYEERP
jgi:glycosyltransferase involved in cell wall biosynthesis